MSAQQYSQVMVTGLFSEIQDQIGGGPFHSSSPPQRGHLRALRTRRFQLWPQFMQTKITLLYRYIF